jgi:hypothetical protein
MFVTVRHGVGQLVQCGGVVAQGAVNGFRWHGNTVLIWPYVAKQLHICDLVIHVGVAAAGDLGIVAITHQGENHPQQNHHGGLSTKREFI